MACTKYSMRPTNVYRSFDKSQVDVHNAKCNLCRIHVFEFGICETNTLSLLARLADVFTFFFILSKMFLKRTASYLSKVSKVTAARTFASASSQEFEIATPFKLHCRHLFLVDVESLNCV